MFLVGKFFLYVWCIYFLWLKVVLKERKGASVWYLVGYRGEGNFGTCIFFFVACLGLFVDGGVIYVRYRSIYDVFKYREFVKRVVFWVEDICFFFLMFRFLVKYVIAMGIEEKGGKVIIIFRIFIRVVLVGGEGFRMRLKFYFFNFYIF